MKPIWGLPTWYVRVFKYLVIATFGLIALGGSVRVMNAGLACPDWPLCFGDVIPDYHPQGYFEFLHPALAGLVSLATAALFYLLLFKSFAPSRLKVVACMTVVLLLTQIVFGGLTVLLQLHSKVVAAHLGMGTGFFGLLLWMYLSMREHAREWTPPSLPGWIRPFSIAVLAGVYGQIILGGLVASHFASLVCTDFPTCHGQWIPTLSGIIGLHVIHRLGAYALFALLVANMVILRKSTSDKRLHKYATWLFLAVCAQIGVGIANVLLHTPPLIAVVHLAVGTTVLALAIRQLHWVKGT
ncbi:MAG TPA: COX15/CtaA family protein [Bdellovibrionales bacterium]|nr:COX15/CtaA family protein [Bdellovibrionales bacterium]